MLLESKEFFATPLVPDKGIVFLYSLGVLECYSEADFGGRTKTGRSTSGVVIKYSAGVISWLSQRQAMMPASTTEAEIVGANAASKKSNLVE